MIALLLATLLTAQAPKPATNTKCPVRGQTYRYCCAGCSGQLMANPDKYLNKDGTPKNAK